MARIYVGTYAKYNSGSLDGKWFDLSDYSDKEEFEQACQDFHGEGEHEFMHQDWEDIPSGLISESNVSPDVWEWLELSEEDQEMFKVYIENINQNGDISEARDAFRGKYESAADYCEEMADACGDLENVPDFIRFHIDWEGVARECDGISFIETGYREVWVFSN